MPETKQLKKSDTKKLSSSRTKTLPQEATKKLTQSKTRAKKIKHSYNVKDAENSLLLKLKNGDVVIEMYPDAAPNHVARIKELVRQGFYNGLKFHRVIEGFMAQTGCPYGNGTGGSGHGVIPEQNQPRCPVNVREPDAGSVALNHLRPRINVCSGEIQTGTVSVANDHFSRPGIETTGDTGVDVIGHEFAAQLRKSRPSAADEFAVADSAASFHVRENIDFHAAGPCLAGLRLNKIHGPPGGLLQR